MNLFGLLLMVLIFGFIEYFSVRLYIKINKDLFWALYHDLIMKEFIDSKGNLTYDVGFWEGSNNE